MRFFTAHLDIIKAPVHKEIKADDDNKIKW